MNYLLKASQTSDRLGRYYSYFTAEETEVLQSKVTCSSFQFKAEPGV